MFTSTRETEGKKMFFELKAKKERLEQELAACIAAVDSGELQAWEVDAFNVEIHEMACELEHANNCLELCA